jgi:hypothetical protein
MNDEWMIVPPGQIAANQLVVCIWCECGVGAYAETRLFKDSLGGYAQGKM